VSGIFFGLWLIPMGYLAAKSKISKVLAGFLVLGGIGYIISTFILVLVPSQKSFAEMLPMSATAGEFWIIGYILIKSRLYMTNK
jgi:hypothetical protein